MEDSSSQQQFLSRLLGPISLLLRYRDGMLGHFVKGVCQRVVQQSQDTQQQQVEGTPSGTGVITGEHDAGVPSPKENVAEVYVQALLLTLKSKDPASIVELVYSRTELRVLLLSAAEDIQKAVAGGHLTHLGNKLLHQVKLFGSESRDLY